jgi:hypothetical protein
VVILFVCFLQGEGVGVVINPITVFFEGGKMGGRWGEDGRKMGKVEKS